MRRVVWVAVVVGGLGACGGDDAGGSQVPVASAPVATTSAASVPKSTTTSAPTATTSTTTVASDPADEDAALATSLLLTIAEFADAWISRLRDDDGDLFDYSQIEGCELMTDLQKDETHAAEAMSATFDSGPAEFEQDARVYPTEEEASEFFLAWTADSVLPCTGKAFELFSSAVMSQATSGEADSVETDVTGGTDEFEGFNLVFYQTVFTVTTGADTTTA